MRSIFHYLVVSFQTLFCSTPFHTVSDSLFFETYPPAPRLDLQVITLLVHLLSPCSLLSLVGGISLDFPLMHSDILRLSLALLFLPATFICFMISSSPHISAQPGRPLCIQDSYIQLLNISSGATVWFKSWVLQQNLASILVVYSPYGS